MKIKIAASKIPKAGRGVFATSAIRRGERIERCPVIILSGADAQVVKKTSLKNYYFIWHPKPQKIAKKVAICLGFGSVYNHSYEPNATYKKNLSTNTIDFFAVRNIRAGEEITTNYNYGNPTDKSTLWIRSIKPAK